MTEQTLFSSVPGIYSALLGLVEEAAKEESNPQVTVVPGELKQYEPAAYIIVAGIKGPRFDWESIGYFAQLEKYEIYGKVSVFTGAAAEPEVVTNAITDTFNIFQRCVMGPIITNRNEPMLGTTGPSPYLMLPQEIAFDAGVGMIAGSPGGWDTMLDWSFHFEANLTPETIE